MQTLQGKEVQINQHLPLPQRPTEGLQLEPPFEALPAFLQRNSRVIQGSPGFWSTSSSSSVEHLSQASNYGQQVGRSTESRCPHDLLSGPTT